VVAGQTANAGTIVMGYRDTGLVSTLAGTAGVYGADDGSGAVARFNYPYGITTDGTNLYIADTGSCTIRKIVLSTGTVTTLAGTAGIIGSADGTGTLASFNGPLGITTDGINLYVADFVNSTIRKIVIVTGTVSTLAGSPTATGSVDGTGAAARFNGPSGITTDGTNLYVADTDNHTIRKIVISTGAVTTFAGAAGLPGSSDGTGTFVKFNRPFGITTDGTNLYVADTYNNTIRKIGISTGAVITLAGKAGTPGSTDGDGLSAQFYYPFGITTDGTNLYVADDYNNTIRKIVTATGAVTTLAGTAGITGSVDGTGTAARFYYPHGIATDGTNLYVTDAYNHTIRKIVITTGAVRTRVSTLAGTPGSLGSANGIGTLASFNGPSSITTDGTNLYVADTDNSSIRKIVIATGAVTTLAGTAGITGSADGTGAAAQFYYPYGIATDGTNLYVADTYNNTIRKIVTATGAVTTLAGAAGIIGSTDGTGAAARFYYPVGMTSDGANLYVADTFNHTIRKIVISTGLVSTFAGAAGSYGSADGTGTAAQFDHPYGVTIDTNGTNLYVSDTYNHTIRKIVISTGAVTTLAGTVGSYGSADGNGSAARFYYPSGITTDGTNLYVADTDNHTIRKIMISTGDVITLVGKAGITGSIDATGAVARFYFPYGITTDDTNLYVADRSNNTIRKIQ
jgi:DNA-binding beta-propeller fold protein YncE